MTTFAEHRERIPNITFSLYDAHCETIINNLRLLPENIAINVGFLTNGRTDWSENENISVLKEVFKFIKSSRRFLIS